MMPLWRPADLPAGRKLRRAGIVYPLWTIAAARKAGLELAVACAILEQETGGGKNEWGHDPTIFVGGRDAKHNVDYGPLVTRSGYLAYKAQRGPQGQGGMQGVGPVQLTWYVFQDRADALGGCWRPYPNMLVGFTDLAEGIRRRQGEPGGWLAAVAAYNGSGAAAARYAASVAARTASFRRLLGATGP